jgi:hypothetical protein
MKLIEAVGDNIEVDDKSYRCNISVPAVLLYFEMMEDTGLTDYEKIETGYQLLVQGDSQIDSDINQQAKVIRAIYQQKISDGESSDNLDKPKNYDFDQDNDLIYSSILQQYNINIRDKDVITNLKWRDFISLFTNLDSKTPFGQAVFFRTVKITDDMSDDQQKYYRDMKQKYALKKNGENLSLAEMDMPHKIAYLAKLRAKQKE